MKELLDYDWELGHEKLIIKVNSYMYGGLYIGLYTKGDGPSDIFCDLTVNLSGYELEDNEAFINDFSSKNYLKFIKQHRLGKVLEDVGHSGYCTYAKVAFDMDRLAELDKKGVERYYRQLEELKALSRLSDILEILNKEDMFVDFREGIPYMERHWQGREVYKYIIRNLLTFNDSGSVENAGIDGKLLSDFIKDAKFYGMRLRASEQKAIQKDSSEKD